MQRVHKMSVSGLPVGRPPKAQESMVKHLKKVYSNREFTTQDVVNSFRLQLIGSDTSPQVKAGMTLSKLRKQGIVQVVGEKETPTRGANLKVYKLKGEVK
jgi:hypothetical protein